MTITKRFRLNRSWLLIAALGVTTSVGAAACANRTADEDAERTEVAEERHTHRGPAVLVVDTALEQAALTSQQQTAMTSIRERLVADSEGKRELKKELKAAAVDVVRAGADDDAEMQRIVDRAMTAIEERVALSGEALAEVHGLLDASQRSDVAAALRQHVEEKFARAERRIERRKRFKKVAAHLMLTGAQLDELKAVKDELVSEKKKLKPTRDQIDGLIDAFEGDDFVAAMNAFHAEKLELMRTHVAKMGTHADTVLSILDADQRDVLAELIEIGPKAAGLTDREVQSPEARSREARSLEAR